MMGLDERLGTTFYTIEKSARQVMNCRTTTIQDINIRDIKVVKSF